jgi:hypothetical protein
VIQASASEQGKESFEIINKRERHSSNHFKSNSGEGTLDAEDDNGDNDYTPAHRFLGDHVAMEDYVAHSSVFRAGGYREKT